MPRARSAADGDRTSAALARDGGGEGSGADLLRHPYFWVAFFGWWTLWAIAFATMFQRTLRAGPSRAPLDWSSALAIGFLDIYLWAAVAAAVLLLARYLPLDNTPWWKFASVHLLVAPALLVGRLVVENGFAYRLDGLTPTGLGIRLLLQTPSHVVAYVMLVGVGYTFEYYRQFAERERRALQLETQLTRARLQALKTQLHPHFLFNALNSVSALLRRDVAEASHTLGRLEHLLRMALERTAAEEVTLREEIEFLLPYLEIEQTRFGDRLSVEWHIDPRTLGDPVPHLILNPLVENAIKHGVAPRRAPTRVEIHARRVDGRLWLEVRDDGVGFNPTPRPCDGEPHPPPHESAADSRQAWRGGGVGLANVRARLAELYRGEHHFEIGPGRCGGTVAAIRIPLRTRPRNDDQNEIP